MNGTTILYSGNAMIARIHEGIGILWVHFQAV